MEAHHGIVLLAERRLTVYGAKSSATMLKVQYIILSVLAPVSPNSAPMMYVVPTAPVNIHVNAAERIYVFLMWSALGLGGDASTASMGTSTKPSGAGVP
jgi:hypothetical protein